MIGRLSQRKAVQRLSGASSAKLVRRKNLIGQAALDMTVPDGATWFRVACTGTGITGGYDENASFYPGAASAFAYNEGVCGSGQAVKISSTTPGEGANVTVTINGVLVCKGAGATMSANGYTRISGKASDCIGLYARSAGEFGGAGIGSQGNGPGGDSDKIDGIGLWGNSGTTPGPGAVGAVNGRANIIPAGSGAVAIEFWSGKR